jgi:hemerythrin-like domain-containing protein
LFGAQFFPAAGLSASEADRLLLQTEVELEEHFTHEEAGGFFAEILDLAPELEDRASLLLQEHQEFRELFHSLRQTCRWACNESGARSGWLAEFVEFYRRFDEHEHAENELMYVALQRDLGAGD